MRLSDLFGEDRILVGFQARDKGEALRKIVETLAAAGHLPASRLGDVLEALEARERISSTGLEHGVALPHAPVEGLERPTAALALAPSGIPFQTADGQPARLIALLVLPHKVLPDHIRILAEIARLLSSERTRQALLGASSVPEVLRLIREGEQPRSGG